jgi:manganese efflux pump family protein
VLKLLAFVLPLGLDSFAVAAAIGATDEQAAGRVATVRGLAIVALGVSISLDEFAIGFSLGLVRLPRAPVIIAIAVQALAASQLGLALGAAISERAREHTEQIAGVALIVLGGYLIIERTIT